MFRTAWQSLTNQIHYSHCGIPEANLSPGREVTLQGAPALRADPLQSKGDQRFQGLGGGRAGQLKLGAAPAGNILDDSKSVRDPEPTAPSPTSPGAGPTRQVSPQAAGRLRSSSQAQCACLAGAAPPPVGVTGFPGSLRGAPLGFGLSPPQGAGPEAGPPRRGGDRTSAPGSTAALPAGLAAGKRLGLLLRPHGSPRLRRWVRLHPDGPGPANPGAAGQLQLGSAFRGQAEAGGEQRPQQPGGQEPEDPGAGAADPGPEGPQFLG